MVIIQPNLIPVTVNAVQTQRKEDERVPLSVLRQHNSYSSAPHALNNLLIMPEDTQRSDSSYNKKSKSYVWTYKVTFPLLAIYSSIFSTNFSMLKL